PPRRAASAATTRETVTTAATVTSGHAVMGPATVVTAPMPPREAGIEAGTEIGTAVDRAPAVAMRRIGGAIKTVDAIRIEAETGTGTGRLLPRAHRARWLRSRKAAVDLSTPAALPRRCAAIEVNAASAEAAAAGGVEGVAAVRGTASR